MRASASGPGTMSRIVDVLSPTLYSTNYGAGWKGFEDPNAHAVEIVDTAISGGNGKPRRTWIPATMASDVDHQRS